MNIIHALRRYRRPINITIKALVVLLLSWVLYRNVLTSEEAVRIKAAFLNAIGLEQLPWLIICVLLMPVNWGLESAKWQALAARIERTSYGRAYQAILAGVTLSLFTPNRVGEYGGRILMVKSDHNWRAVVATMVGYISQWIPLLGIGTTGLLWTLYSHSNVNYYVLSGVMVIGFSFTLWWLVCYFRVSSVLPLLMRIKWLRKYITHLEVLRKYRRHELVRILALSICRYSVYVTQYYLVLRFFGVEVGLLQGLAGASAIFIIQTSIPLPPVVSVVMRGEVALFVFGPYGANELSILASTYSLWMLNLILPALAGLVVIIRANVLRSLVDLDSTPPTTKATPTTTATTTTEEPAQL